ncbi:hypothetical protein, partial [Nocardioides hungaricus]
AALKKRHRHQEFLAFLRQNERTSESPSAAVVLSRWLGEGRIISGRYVHGRHSIVVAPIGREDGKKT